MKVLCATGNLDKYSIGKRAFDALGLELKQVVIEIDEIQGADLVRIVEDKAQKAFAILGKPVIVTDDGWSIAALNGFPGAYMKEVNHWFSPEDFLRLVGDAKDRSVTLLQQLAYCDEHETVTFTGEVHGTITTEPRGEYGPPIMKIVELENSDGHTISELHDKGITHKINTAGTVWTELGEWLKAKSQTS